MDRLRYRCLISSEVERLKADFALQPVVAAELEFSLLGLNENQDTSELWSALREYCQQEEIALVKIEKERSKAQYETALAPTDAQHCADSINSIKTKLTSLASEQGLEACFDSKPIEGEAGNGLHIHVHLEDEQGRNVFTKDDKQINDPLKHSLGGLLAWLPDCMPIFAPNESSYARFVPCDHTPLTCSWGANNRTTALRLPDSRADNKRIEHRVPCADADAQSVIAIILAAIHDGMSKKTQPPEQFYGNANLPKYDLPIFPHNLAEAKQRMENSPFFS